MQALDPEHVEALRFTELAYKSSTPQGVQQVLDLGLSLRIILGTKGDVVYIAARGTVDANNWFQTNFNSGLVQLGSAIPQLSPEKNTGTVYKGWGDAYNRVRIRLLSKVQELFDASGTRFTKIVCTGHSLGGALATLAAVDIAVCQKKSYYQGKKIKAGKVIDVEVVSFASPHVGDAHFGEFYRKHVSETVRYYIPTDPVPVVMKAAHFAVHHVTDIPKRPNHEDPQHLSQMLGCGGSAHALVQSLLRILEKGLPSLQAMLMEATGDVFKQALESHGLKAYRGALTTRNSDALSMCTPLLNIVHQYLNFNYGHALKSMLASAEALVPSAASLPSLSTLSTASVPLFGAAVIGSIWISAYYTNELIGKVHSQLTANEWKQGRQMLEISQKLSAIDERTTVIIASLKINSTKLDELGSEIADRADAKELEKNVRNLRALIITRSEILQGFQPLVSKADDQTLQPKAFEDRKLAMGRFHTQHQAKVLELYMYFRDSAGSLKSARDRYVAIECALLAADLRLRMLATMNKAEMVFEAQDANVSIMFDELARAVGSFAWDTDLCRFKSSMRSGEEEGEPEEDEVEGASSISDETENLSNLFRRIFMPFEGQPESAVSAMLNNGSAMLPQEKDKARDHMIRAIAIDVRNPIARLALHLIDVHTSTSRDQAELKVQKEKHADDCLTCFADLVMSSTMDTHPMHVVFAGLTDAGKSTLINAILNTQLKDFPQDLDPGNNFLHVKQTECTSVIAQIEMGKQEYSWSRDSVRKGGVFFQNVHFEHILIIYTMYL
jgi:hypothetical protein